MNNTVRNSAMTNGLSPANLDARSAAFARALASPPDRGMYVTGFQEGDAW